MNDKLFRHIKDNRVNRFAPLAFLLVFGALGAAWVFQSQAASVKPDGGNGATMYITPSRQQLAAGDTLTVSIWTDSQSVPADAVHAVLTYPADKLEYSSSDATGSAYTSEDETDVGDGQVALVRHGNGGLTGKQLVTTVTFRAKNAGDATVAVSDKSQLLSAGSHGNVLTGRTSGQFTIR